MPSIKHKILTLSAVGVILAALIFSFAVFHIEDGTDKISFVLTDQHGNKTTHEDLSNKPMMVFFGFTSCIDVCPVGLLKLAAVAEELEPFNQDEAFNTVMITIDPERDTEEQLRAYLSNFNDNFIGLTGSRTALENVAAEFNTFIPKPPEHAMHGHSDHGDTTASTNQHLMGALADSAEHTASDHGSENFIDNYQLAHSSVIYLVDTYSQVVEYISLDEDIEVIVEKLRMHLANNEMNHG